MTDEKSHETQTRLRRSTRSTRGSVKPVVDLTLDEDIKQEVEEDDEVEVIEKPTATKKKKRQSISKAPKAAKGTKSGDVQEQKPEAIKKELAEDSDDVEISYDLSEKEMKEINNAFDLNCSPDGEELLDSDKLKTAIRSLGFEPRADEIQKLLKKYSNKQGKINRDKFHQIMAFKMGSSLSTNDNVLNDEISRVFNLLDLDKTGLITLENLRSISKELNEEITDEELHEMITEADTDGDFQINKLEFYNIMKKTSLY